MTRKKAITITEELISRAKLLKREYMPDAVNIMEQKTFTGSEEEDEFYKPAIELLDFIYRQIRDKAS